MSPPVSSSRAAVDPGLGSRSQGGAPPATRDYASKLLRLLEYSTRASERQSLEDTLSLLLLSLMGEYAATRAAILMPDDSGTLRVRVARGAIVRATADADPSTGAALAGGMGPTGSAIETIGPALGYPLLIPIRHHTGLLGAIGLGPRASGEAYTSAEAEFVRLVAGIAGTAIASHQLYEELRAVNRRVERQLFDLHTLFDIGRELTTSLEPEGVYRVVAQTVMAHLLVSRCIVLAADDEHTQVAFERGLRLDEDRLHQIERTHFVEATDAVEQDRDPPFMPVLRAAGIRHLIPLRGGGEIRGFVGVGAKTGDEPLARHEVEFMSMLGAQAVNVLDNLRFHADRARRERIERELGIAREIQRALLPAELPRLDGYDLAAVSEPCYEVGGDYYDSLHLPQGLVLAIGDVSGKSVPAALLMSVLQATVRNLAGRLGETPASLTATLNQHLARSTQAGKFVTFFLAALDPATGTLLYTNAGHNPPMLVRADGTIDRLVAGGPVLGVFEETHYDQGQTRLEPGDLLFTFTDGVTEAVDRDDEEFGEARLEGLLRSAREAAAEEVIRRVVAAVRSYANGLVAGDDLTALAVKRLEA